VVGLAIAALLLLVAAEVAPPPEALAWAAVAGTSGALGLVCFYLALSRGTMGLVAPLTALIGASVPAAVGLAAGGSTPPVVLAGLVSALVAVVLITLPDRRLGAPAIATFHGSRMRELGIVVAAGLGFAGFFLSVDRSHEAGGDVWWPLLVVKLGGAATMTVVALALLLARRMPQARSLRAAILVAGVSGIGDLGGNLFFVMASDVGELAVVVVLASLYPVTTALLAAIVLHERLRGARLGGVALAIASVVLIGAGSA
jgi:drug/metabolite transporter (DMT)-like permease